MDRVLCQGPEEEGGCPDREDGVCRIYERLPICAIARLADSLEEAGVRLVVPCGKCRHWVPEDGKENYGRCYGFGKKTGYLAPGGRFL